MSIEPSITFEEAIVGAIKLTNEDINPIFHENSGKYLEFSCTVRYDKDKKDYEFLNISLETP